MKNLTAIILAAGKGTRMKSNQAKVLHPLAGKPMLQWVMDGLKQAGISRRITIIGHQAEAVRKELGNLSEWVYQEDQLGTGHAVIQAIPLLANYKGSLLIISGDTPLILPETLQALYEFHKKEKAVATLLTTQLANPLGYGRVIRDKKGLVEKIVEEKDASAKERQIKEINSGIYCFEWPMLRKALHRLEPSNAQKEYYLTDVIQILVHEKKKISAFIASDPQEVMGINDRIQLSQAQKVIQDRIRNHWMKEGVTLIHPESIYIDGDVQIGQDTVIYPDTFLEKGSIIGKNCQLGPFLQVRASQLKNGVQASYSVILESTIRKKTIIGPFAHLRNGVMVGEECRIGNFVEVKASTLGDKTKAAHLSYIGDAHLGNRVNIGAGTITCNYDGHTKHKTIIQDDAFIGSDSIIVAPVTIGKGAITGAGSTITRDVPPGNLGISRPEQKNLPWKKKDLQKNKH